MLVLVGILLYVLMDLFNFFVLQRKLYSTSFPDGMVRWFPVVLVYTLYPIAVGLIVKSTTVQQRSLDGLLLGVTVYGVYNMTNLGTLSRWTVPLAVWDTVWGSIVTSVLAAAS
jgi:uncharacterized membrane protein